MGKSIYVRRKNTKFWVRIEKKQKGTGKQLHRKEDVTGGRNQQKLRVSVIRKDMNTYLQGP